MEQQIQEVQIFHAPKGVKCPVGVESRLFISSAPTTVVSEPKRAARRQIHPKALQPSSATKKKKSKIHHAKAEAAL